MSVTINGRRVYASGTIVLERPEDITVETELGPALLRIGQPGVGTDAEGKRFFGSRLDTTTVQMCGVGGIAGTTRIEQLPMGLSCITPCRSSRSKPACLDPLLERD